MDRLHRSLSLLVKELKLQGKMTQLIATSIFTITVAVFVQNHGAHFKFPVVKSKKPEVLDKVPEG